MNLQRIDNRGGEWLKASCPFQENHKNGDKNRSFGISLDGTATYHCFVCGTGDVARLLMRLWGKTFTEVIEWLRGYVKIDPTKLLENYERVSNKKIFRFEEFRLRAVQGHVSPYIIHQRHISLKTYVKFRLGHFAKGKIVYFPLYDFDEKLIGLFTRPTEQKAYIFEEGTPRSEWLYGLERSRKEHVFLVESPMDCLYLNSLGYNSVASMGANFSSQQAQLCIDRFPSVCYIRHNDAAGVLGLNKAYSAINNTIPFYKTKVYKHRKDVNEMTPDEVHKLIKTQYLYLKPKE